MDGWTILGAWVAVSLTFGLYSFLYKDNPVFKFCEHVYLGTGMGWLLVSMYFTIVKPDLLVPLAHVFQAKVFGKNIELQENETFWLLIPAFLSVFLLLRFVPKLAWLSRWSFAFLVGGFAGMAIPATVSADIFKQTEGTLRSWSGLGGFWDVVNSSLILIGVVSVLFYFFFSVEHKGVAKTVARVGIVFIMISLGAAFGYTVMARESLLIGRVQELIETSSKDYYFATPILFQLMVILVLVLEWARTGKERAATDPATA